MNMMNKNFYRKFFGLKASEGEDGFYDDFLAKEFILRDYLAVERTVLANESTFLAYIRTSITFVAGGVTLMQVSNIEKWQDIGEVAIALGCLFFLFGCFQALKMSRKIRRFMNKKREVDLGVGKEN